MPILNQLRKGPWGFKSFLVSMAFLLQVPLVGLGTAHAAEDETQATIDAYAAGYIANFVCSATFNRGTADAVDGSPVQPRAAFNKPLEQIKEHELTGIYDLVARPIEELFERGAVVVDEQAQRVSVAYSESGMPPRISVWRPLLGCVDLPVGAEAEAASHVEGLMGELATWAHPQQDNGAPWQRRAGLNQATGIDALDTTIKQAFSTHYGEGARTSAVLIASPEAILAEHYIEGFGPTTAQRTWSVAKSIGASVVGAAVEDGLVDVQAPAALASWSHPADPRQQITLEHLLHMSSGLDSNLAGNRTDRVYMGGGTVLDEAVGNSLEAQPGERWKYANNDTMLALRALRERFDSPQAYLAYPFTQLLHKIGMHHTFLETDWQGDFILSSQVWTTSRDLARLGVLHLQQGQWQGEQILPADWLEYVSTAAPVQPESPNQAGTAVPGYGAQWWLFNERIEGIPNETIAARGNRGQFLIVVPSRNLVIVRRGYDLAGQDGFDEIQFTRDILQALPQHD